MDVKDSNGKRLLEQELIAAAINELKTPTFGVTEQFLEIHTIVIEDGQPKVAGLSINDDGSRAAVYFAVTGERFYFAVYLDLDPEPNIRGVDTEDYNSVYFQVVSETMSQEQLAALTTLSATEGWSKGDPRSNPSRTPYTFSSLVFEPTPGPAPFEDKLNKLLDFLEQDRTGVQVLLEQADAGIQVHTIFHNGNTMLGGVHLDKQHIQRLADLNLEIDFDLYAEGNFFQS